MSTVSCSLPLHCSVCPKKPNFSDVSHLLTHVASKGHLSHYYKLKVRASQDLNARTLIEQYDRWYDQWDVEHLMAQRMRQKEKKRSRPRNPATGTDVRHNKRAVHVQSKGAELSPQMALPGPIPIKQEPAWETNNLSNVLPSSPITRPRLHLWDTLCPSSHEAVALDSSSPVPVIYPSVELATHNGQRELDGIAVDEVTKLKGAIWPGMDIFDAATPEMRRKRNQKKDTSVLDQLEKNSEKVEPTEVIYYPFGQIKKQRRISGRVESSSPELCDLPPPPPRRKAHARQALLDKDVNNSATQAKPSRTRRVQQAGASGRRRAFAVHREEDEEFGHPTGLTVLTSEFRPQLHRSVVDASIGVHSNPPSPAVPCVSTDLQSMYHSGVFDPPQHCLHHSLYGPANLNYYSQNGYDLGAFFANQLAEVPFTRLQPQHAPWWPIHHESSSREETADSPGESYGQAETVTTASTKGDSGSNEDQETLAPCEQPLFDEGFESHVNALAALSDFDQELMQQATVEFGVLQH